MIVDFEESYDATICNYRAGCTFITTAQSNGWCNRRTNMIETTKAGIAVGADGIFIETHFDPANAKSDGANMLHLDYFEA
jgi:3-deoxy-D-manno-octulosonic acid (KDO) 8-phosphate synthase